MPTDTQFPATVVMQRWDGFTDFPLFPLSLPATPKALAGITYVHTAYNEVSLDPNSPLYNKGTVGTVKQPYENTTFYFIPTENLPLLQLPRDLGVPEPILAAVEPALTWVIEETGYDRSIPFGEPTPARLIPRIDPFAFTVGLADAIDQGVEDALDEITDPTPRPPGPPLPKRCCPSSCGHSWTPCRAS